MIEKELEVTEGKDEFDGTGKSFPDQKPRGS